MISRAVFKSEYAESLIQCVGGTVGEAPMLRHHELNVEAIENKLRPLIEAFREINDNNNLHLKECLPLS